MFIQKTSFYCIIVVIISVGLTSVNGFDVEKDVIFRLYNRNERGMYYALEIGGSLPGFDPKKPTRIFIHGFKSKEKVIHRYKDAYLDLGDYNYIAVDWTEGAKTYNYYSAKGRVGPVAFKLSELIDTLVNAGMNLQDVTMVGHSLGAHIAGRAAKQLKSPGKIAVIIGLDPAGVGIDFFDRDRRLTDSDADYVQVIHTDGDKFGTLDPLGHADIYPNGGKRQPGCPLRNALTNLIEKCSHVRSHHLFLESLKADFPAIQCVSYEEIQNGKCTFNNVMAKMGGDITATSPKAHGIFYLETKTAPPYVIPDYRSFNHIDFITYETA